MKGERRRGGERAKGRKRDPAHREGLQNEVRIIILPSFYQFNLLYPLSLKRVDRAEHWQGADGRLGAKQN